MADDGPQRRRARACIHTETVLPDEESTWLPEALVGRRRNRALSLVFVEDIEAMEEQVPCESEAASLQTCSDESVPGIVALRWA